MANKIYLSDLMLNGAVVCRGANAGQVNTVTGSVRIPSGTTLAASDTIKIGRFPSGTLFTKILAVIPDLDSSNAIELDVGYSRPVTDPALAYDATTNPYTSGAIATADVTFFEAAATTGKAGGTLVLDSSGFTVTTSLAVSGDVDVTIIPSTPATGSTAADVTIKFMLEYLSTQDNQTQGEFSGDNALDYNTNYDI